MNESPGEGEGDEHGEEDESEHQAPGRPVVVGWRARFFLGIGHGAKCTAGVTGVAFCTMEKGVAREEISGFEKKNGNTIFTNMCLKGTEVRQWKAD
jgi:hypothetical protein